jgi:DNA-binding beta-propeller fold protein YncE
MIRLAGAGAVALALLLACAAGQESPNGLTGWKVDPAWPRKPADFAWGDMPGVAVDAKDRVWIFTRAKPAVQVYSPGGDVVRSWNHVEQKTAHHIKFDPEGNVWVADVGFHTVSKYTPEGKLLLQLGTKDQAGEDEARFNKPTDMAVSPAGDIFVSDGYGNNRVVHFDKGGRFVKAWGRKGAAPGEFNLPHGIGLDSKGRLYVADRNNARIQVFDQGGTFLDEWKNLLVPWSVWVTPEDEIWTCGSSPTLHVNEGGMTGIPPHDQVLAKFSPSGKLLQVWMPPKGQDGQEKPGELNWVHAVAADSKGNLYCGDIKGKRVQKFVPVR